MRDEHLLEEYLLAHTSPEPEALAFIARETHLKTIYPQMLSGPVLGAFLRMVSWMTRPERALEIGTFTGYSSLCLADGLAKGGQLHTIEQNPEHWEMIRRHLSGHGLDERILLHQGDALALIPTIPGPFDLAFIDGDKTEYIAYYESIVPRMRPGGLIVADNVLWGGKVLRDGTDKETSGIKAFNAYVASDARTEQVMLPMRDGVMLIRVVTGTSPATA